MSEDESAILRRLDERVQALEDELAITRLLVTYGFAVDTDDVEAMLALFHPDARIVVDGEWEMKGHEDARQIVEGPTHQSYLPLCAHNIGPFTVEVNGARAVAKGYSRVYLRRDDGFRVERVSFNRWELERSDSGWLITERHTALLGVGDAAHALLRRQRQPGDR
jgi:hypothetical protein